MKPLTIRTKITLWYTLVLLSLIAIIVPVVLVFVKQTLYTKDESILKAYSSNIISSIEIENGKLKLDKIYSNINTESMVTVYDNKNIVLYSNCKIKNLNTIPIKINKLQITKVNNVDYLLLDDNIIDEGSTIAYVRAIKSLEPVNETINELLFAILIFIPFYIIISIIGSLFLAKKALLPIDKITVAAREIGNGNLTKRLNMKITNDEVGRLAETFDDMINKLDNSFKKERLFSSSASHELRTPISVISAYAENALEKETDLKEYRNTIQIILQQTQKMNRIISQLLLMTRGDDNSHKPEFELINLTEIIKNIILEMKELHKNENILFDSKNKVVLMADQTLIMRMMINLINNAIKYNKNDGYINIDLNNYHNKVIITVEDKGIGISKEDMPYIFDKFFKGDKSRNSDGVGLGLSIVKWIVDIHKGEITVNSMIDEGTKITISLPSNNSI